MDLMKRIKKARFMRPTGYPPVYIYIEGRAGFSYLACASIAVVGICKVHRFVLMHGLVSVCVLIALRTSVSINEIPNLL